PATGQRWRCGAGCALMPPSVAARQNPGATSSASSACGDECGFCAGSVLATHDGGGTMSKVIASITTSVDGYVTGPDDGPQYGLGRGGERLHYWVMGGPWTYQGGHDFAMHGPDKEFYNELVSTLGCGMVGRGLFDGFGQDVNLQVARVYSSPYATHVRYTVTK